MRLLLVLLSGSTSIFVNAVSLPRLRVAGITAAERALVSSAAETAAGSKFTLEQVPVPDLTSMQTRIVIFDGFDIDADEWLLQTIAEELDQAEIDRCFSQQRLQKLPCRTQLTHTSRGMA